MEDGLLSAYIDYRKNELVLIERKGDRVWLNRRPAEHSLFLKKDETPRDLYVELCQSEAVVGVQADGDFWRVKFAERDVCRKMCEILPRTRGVFTYDGDVAPARRYLTDTGRKIVRPRAVYLDIETDSRVPFSRKEEARVLCWTLVCAKTGREFRGMLGEDNDESESTLLRAMWDTLDQFDQVLSWNGDRFDFEVIKARTKKCKLTYIQPRRWLWLDHMSLFERMNVMAAESGDEKQSLALESIAQAVLGYGKDDFDSSKTWQEWATGDRKKLADYCARDTQLMRDIELKTGYVELFQTLCDVCGVFPDSSGLRPATRVEGYLFAIAKRTGHRFKTRLERGGTETDKYKGAFVLHPTKSGILKSVQVCDFSSLYPSIIITWNASPETRVLKGEGPRPAYVCEAPGTDEWFDTRVKGILVVALEEILELRKFWDKKKKEAEPNTPEWIDAYRRVTAYKIAANAFYGVIGSPWSRFFDRYVAEAITQAGAWLIKNVIKAGEIRGYETLASDTDSSFVLGATTEDFRRFIAYCNEELIPPLVTEIGCKTNRISLGYDKEFERLIIPVDDDGKAIAKRYVGRVLHKGGKMAGDDSEPEIKGFEFKRGDSARMTRSMQKEVIDLFCKARCEDASRFTEICARYKARVLNDPLELVDVKVSKSLGKPLKGYVRKTKKNGEPSQLPPHVEVGLILAERGREVDEGVKVDYVVVDGAAKPKRVIPAEDWTGEFDRFELWENIIWPPTRRLLAAAFPEADLFEFDYVRDTRKKKKLEFARRKLDLIDWIDETMAKKAGVA